MPFPLGKPLVIDEAEAEELPDLKCVVCRSFPAPVHLYPGHDLSKKFHQDDALPRSNFTRKRLRNAGTDESKIDAFLQRVDMLPNLHSSLADRRSRRVTPHRATGSPSRNSQPRRSAWCTPRRTTSLTFHWS